MGKPKKEERKPTQDPNVVIFGGRMTRDPEERGKTVVFGLAVHNRETVEAGGEPVEVPFFPEVTGFASAKHVLEHGKKGKRVVVTGRLAFDEYKATYANGDVIYRDEAKKEPVMKLVPRVRASSVEYL